MTTQVYRAACHASDRHDTEGAAHDVVSHVAEKMHGMTDVAIVFLSGHHVQRVDIITSTIYDLLAPKTVIGCTCVSVAASRAIRT
jgi:small ligand-binding sensory domain FIST